VVGWRSLLDEGTDANDRSPYSCRLRGHWLALREAKPAPNRILAREELCRQTIIDDDRLAATRTISFLERSSAYQMHTEYVEETRTDGDRSHKRRTIGGRLPLDLEQSLATVERWHAVGHACRHDARNCLDLRLQLIEKRAASLRARISRRG
jgi:hypothetical protein